MASLTIFANFRIDSAERLQRMKDSFLSFRSIHAEQWIINIRGEYKAQAAAFLEEELENLLELFHLESPEGWFHDSRIMAANIYTSHVLFWIEDHLNLVDDCAVYSGILNEMEAADIEFLPYSFHWVTQRYEWIPQTEMKYITWLDLNHENFKLFQEKAPEAYIIFCLGIFNKKLFDRIIFKDDIHQAIKWPVETPFAFEKSSYDEHWLPIRVGLPKSELFAAIDDDSVQPGSCLIARGLYEPRQKRKMMGMPEAATPLSMPAKDCERKIGAVELTAIYNNQFYAEHQDASVKSARAVVPVILDVFKAQSVIDVGCGVGGWLRVFQNHDVRNILGFDGNELESEKYYVDKNCIRTHVDFASDQFKIPQKADLLICLEVAEHLPHADADRFIRNLTNGSSAIIFSAAIPEQTGVNHVNEQPPWYWREKFNKLGYYEVDFIRPLIWLNEDISWWYRQNITCYVTKEVLLGNSKLLELAKVHGQRKDQHKLTIINEWVLQNMFAAKVSQQNSDARQQINSRQSAAMAPMQGARRSVSSISVIIPTRNRAASIERTLHSLAALENPGCPYEIIVVDNGSTDTTRQTVESFRHKLAGLTYICEPNPGLHNGRHRGAFAARGQVLCYLDDDVKVDPKWLYSVRQAFEKTEAVLVGGRILPEYEQPAPDWIKEYLYPLGNYGYYIGQLTLIDQGQQIREIDPVWVWGANFSIRKDVLFECGGFHPDSMPEELIHLRGDGETGLSLAIREKGYKAVYHPGVLVRHCISKDRLTRQYFETRMFNQGISDSFTEIRRSGKVNVLTPSAALDASQQGKLFHQQQVHSNPQLLSWVLRKDYYSDIKTQTPASLSPQVRYELYPDPAVPV